MVSWVLLEMTFRAKSRSSQPLSTTEWGPTTKNKNIKKIKLQKSIKHMQVQQFIWIRINTRKEFPSQLEFLINFGQLHILEIPRCKLWTCSICSKRINAMILIQEKKRYSLSRFFWEKGWAQTSLDDNHFITVFINR